VGEPEISDIGRGLFMWAERVSFVSGGSRKEVSSEPPPKFETVLQRMANEKPGANRPQPS